MVKRGKIKIVQTPFYLRQSNTSESAAMLHVGNEFLERCLVNNSLQEFAVAIEKYVSGNNKEERERLLRAIATWLEVFVTSIYLERVRSQTGLRRMVKHVPVFGPWVEAAYLSLAHLAFPIRKRKRLRIKEIEPFVITRNELKGITTKS
jgi:hypothetical protein